jgi:hypothetical protein
LDCAEFDYYAIGLIEAKQLKIDTADLLKVNRTLFEALGDKNLQVFNLQAQAEKKDTLYLICQDQLSVAEKKNRRYKNAVPVFVGVVFVVVVETLILFFKK